MLFLNKYVLIGIFLIIIGFFLSPFIIGIPIMIFGFFVGDFGILYGIVKKVPGLENKIKELFLMIKKSYEPCFKKRGERK